MLMDQNGTSHHHVSIKLTKRWATAKRKQMECMLGHYRYPTPHETENHPSLEQISTNSSRTRAASSAKKKKVEKGGPSNAAAKSKKLGNEDVADYCRKKNIKTLDGLLAITTCHYHHNNYHHLSLSSYHYNHHNLPLLSSQPAHSVTIIITTSTICHYYHLIITATIICHYYHHNYRHLSQLSSQPPPSIIITATTHLVTIFTIFFLFFIFFLLQSGEAGHTYMECDSVHRCIKNAKVHQFDKNSKEK